MLIDFKVGNYRSIRDEQTLSMVASNHSDELPQNLIACDHVLGLEGTKLVKAVALYGANASGKSNVIGALEFFARFVRDSATKLSPVDPTGAQPFKLDPAFINAPSRFEINAVIGGTRMLYGLELTSERVTSEYLVAYPKRRPQTWFERDWDATKEKYTWSRPTTEFKHDRSLHDKTRQNAAFVSVMAQFNSERAVEVVKWITNHVYFLGASPQFTVRSTARRLLMSEQTLDVFSRLLSQADVGVEAVAAKQPKGAEAESEVLRIIATSGLPQPEIDVLSSALVEYRQSPEMQKVLEAATTKVPPFPELHHRGANGTLVPFDFFKEESLGTHRYFELFAELGMGAVNGRLVVADELEVSLHPLLLRNVIDFALKASTHEETKSNPLQFIFTTHNPLLLDKTLLRRDQIWFTEKDQEGATRLYPLTDFKPRKDESLVKGYLAGRYGGVPFIPDGLKI